MSPLLGWSLRASATIALGLLLALALRRRSAATRSLVLRATLASVLALPLAAAFAPRVEVPLTSPLPPSGSSWGKGQEGGGSTGATLASSGWSVEPSPEKGAPSALVQRTPLRTVELPVGSLLFALWLGGSGLFVLRLLAGVARLVGLRRRATPTDAPDVWRAALSVPATYGRTILLPLESDAWPEARRRAAILHERAHVARRDWYWQVLATLFAAIHWPNPLAWWLLRSLRDAAEAAADDAALAHMAPSEYARELLAVAKNAGRVGPALAMARRGGVRDRVVAVLAPQDRRGPSVRAGVLLLAIVGLYGIVVAGIEQSRKTLVRLLDVSDRTGVHWDLAGHRVPASRDSSDGGSFGVPKGFRWVTMRLDLGDSLKGHGIRIEVPPPVQANGYGPTDSEGQPLWLSTVAPEGLRRTDVRIGLAEGEWKEMTGSAVFRRTVTRVIGGSDPQYILGLDFPTRYRGEQVRVVARLKSGTAAKVVGTGMGYEDAFVRMHGSPKATIQLCGRPDDLASVVLQHRPYAWTLLRDVALRPKGQVQSSREITLLDVREVAPHPSLRWDAQGRTVPTPHDVAQRAYVPGLWDRSAGQRLAEVRFALPRATDLSGWVLNPQDSDTQATFGFEPKRKQSILEAAVYAPKTRARATFRIGVPSETWTRASLSPTDFVVRPLPKAPWVRWLEIPWPAGSDPRPRSPGEVAFKLVIRDARGVAIEWTGLKWREEGDRRIASLVLNGKGLPATLALWTRPYAWTTIPDVPLVRPTP